MNLVFVVNKSINDLTKKVQVFIKEHVTIEDLNETGNLTWYTLRMTRLISHVIPL